MFGCGPDGKMPPDTAGKDARRYRSVAASECAVHIQDQPVFLFFGKYIS
jgi:hypothetical protein